MPPPDSTTTGTASDWRRYLALERDVSLLLAALVLMNLGLELWIRFVPQLLVVLGAGAWAVGAYDALRVVLGAVYAYPGGVLADRHGFRRSLVLFTLLTLAGYLLIWALPLWQVLLVGSLFYFSWTGFSLPSSLALIGSRLGPGQRAMGIAVQSLVKRVPILVAPVAGGFLLDRLGIVEGFRSGVLAATLAALATLLLLRRIGGQGLPAGVTPAAVPPAPGDPVPPLDRRLKALLISDILVRFCERIPYAFVVLYALNTVGVSAVQFGLLTSLEMATSMICYIPAAHFADRMARRPFVLATFAFFTLFPLALLVSGSFAGLAVAFFVRGLKEFGDSARKALILDLAPEAARGRVIGKYYLVRDLLVTPGSLLGAYLWSLSPAANFLVAAAAGLGGTLYYAVRQARGE